MPVRRLAALAVAAVALGIAPSARGAAWKQLTSPGGSNIDQVALLRTSDGTLHVAWHRRSGPNTEDLLHTAISASGAILATTPIQTGWSVLQNAALVPVPGGGIRVFFGGIRSTDTSDPNQELNTALSTDGGATWALQEGSVVPGGAEAYGSPVSATTLPDGTPLEAWAGTLGTWAHAGLSPDSANHDYQAPLGTYGYDTGMAADAGGRAVMAWYSNAGGHLGLFAQDVGPDGSPVGAATNMPGTANMSVGMLGRTPIVARAGGGIYVAYATGYPSINQVRLWRVGASGTTLIARTAKFGNTTATLAAAPDGRLWVAWKDDIGGGPHVFARRSNKAAGAFGAAVDAGQPRGASSAYRLDASATPGALDLFGLFTIGTEPSAETFHTRVLPGLTLTASPGRLRRGRRSAVTFTVLDAGDPVRGARVKVGGRSATTNAKGRATLVVKGVFRPLRASATAGGYAGAAARLRVGA
jgi:hypothetical protein